MKLNNTQIKALAQEVLNKIPKKEPKFTKEQLTKFSKIVNEFNKLDKDLTIIESKMNKLRDIVKNEGIFNKYLYNSDLIDIKSLEKKLVEKDYPKLEDIIHKITLETVFETKESLTDFIDNLVKQYSK